MLVNAELAFFSACGVLFSFMLHDAKNEPEFEKFLIEREMLHFPQCKNSDSKESYLVQTIKTLCQALKRDKLSVLMLSNIFCLLEDNTIFAYKIKA